MPVKCFMLHEIPRAQVSLRRFNFGDQMDNCPGRPGWGHDASAIIAVIDSPLGSDLDCSGRHSREDSRWPTRCEWCEYAFQPSDEWQRIQERLYKTDDGIEYTLNERPVGSFVAATWLWGINDAMMSEEYLRERKQLRAPLFLRTPGGDWCIDQRSTTGAGWHITGEAPLITATPSIDTGRYHGFLQNGVLTDDLDGRQYLPQNARHIIQPEVIFERVLAMLLAGVTEALERNEVAERLANFLRMALDELRADLQERTSPIARRVLTRILRGIRRWRIEHPSGNEAFAAIVDAALNELEASIQATGEPLPVADEDDELMPVHPSNP